MWTLSYIPPAIVKKITIEYFVNNKLKCEDEIKKNLYIIYLKGQDECFNVLIRLKLKHVIGVLFKDNEFIAQKWIISQIPTTTK
jgi:intein-encoded DNA endonuclease-like protein